MIDPARHPWRHPLLRAQTPTTAVLSIVLVLLVAVRHGSVVQLLPALALLAILALMLTDGARRPRWLPRYRVAAGLALLAAAAAGDVVLSTTTSSWRGAQDGPAGWLTFAGLLLAFSWSLLDGRASGDRDASAGTSTQTTPADTMKT